MALSKGQKTDLDGLISGLGTRESDVRAQTLVRDSEEAAAYLEETRYIRELFQPPAARDEDVMSSSEAGVIATKILERWGQSRGDVTRTLPVQTPSWFRSAPAGAIAAMLFIGVCASWVWLTTGGASENVVIGQLRLRSAGTTAVPSETTLAVHGGDLIESRNRKGVLTLTNGTTLIVQPRSTIGIRYRRELNEFSLIRGHVFLRVTEPAAVLMDGMSVELHDADAELRHQDRNSCHVFRGAATVVISGETLFLRASELVAYDPELGEIVRSSSKGSIPEWAADALRGAR